MTAEPLMFEPVDPADLPLVPVSHAAFYRIATTLGAGPVERDGDLLVVVFNGRQYVTEAQSREQP